MRNLRPLSAQHMDVAPPPPPPPLLRQVGEAYKATGRCFSVAAGRISFCYGLKGAPGQRHCRGDAAAPLKPCPLHS